ncbi:hypothetical protein BDZ91DRAFT_731473 [Kalaharituber pfeilii]|nr:hypothetical protein BDZ91DRAFT_731473 [Kalaharituber pfeilii]
MQDQAPRASPRLRTPAMSYALGGSNGSTSTPTTTILTPPNLPTRFGSDNHPQRTSSYPTANKPRSILPPQVTRAHPSSTPLSQYTYNRPWSSLLECQDRGDTRSGNSESHSLSLLQKYLSDDSLLLSTLLSRRCPLTFHCITYPDFVDLGLFDPCYKHLRVNYDSRSETLKLWMPNTPLHDCVQHWASEMLTRIGRHMLTDDEADSLRGVNPSVRLPTSLYTSTHTPTDEYINEKDSPLSSDEPTSRNASRWQNAKRKMTALSPLQSPAKSTLRIIKWQTTQETGGRTKVAIAVLFGETDSPLPLRRRELWDKYALAFQERLDAEASLLDNDSGEHRTSAWKPSTRMTGLATLPPA